MVLQIMTANRLLDGEVVYLTDSGDWSEHYAKARVVEDKDQAEEVQAIAKQAELDHKTVGAYLAKVDRNEDGSIRLISMKESIRAAGPTTRRDLGKQAKSV